MLLRQLGSEANADTFQEHKPCNVITDFIHCFCLLVLAVGNTFGSNDKDGKHSSKSVFKLTIAIGHDRLMKCSIYATTYMLKGLKNFWVPGGK